MPSIDERVVSMAFENARFEQGVARTMKTLANLNASLAKVGTQNGLADIEKAANKVTLEQPASALQKLKSKLNFGREASDGFGDINKAGNRVTLEQPAAAVDKFNSKIATVGVHASDSFGNVQRASSRVTMEEAGSAIDGLSQRFGAMEIAAVAAFGTVISKMTLVAGRFAKKMTVSPIIGGYKEYELKLNSIQTILANTKASGATLKDVTGSLNELNHYADKTIYNFGQMAKNIGTFTAAGVDLKTATASIKGIANLAALSGTNSQKASVAMYQLSQAISSGKVSLMDWKSVENAGMGGAVFQRNLAESAVAMGVLDKDAVKLTGKMKNVTINGESFRQSISAKNGGESWLTSKVLTSSLQNFTGDLSAAELKAKGFSKEQIKAIMAQAKTAVDAATKVKTFTQLMDTTKESLESGWAETWEIIFGDFDEARKLWSGVSKAVGGFIQKTADGRNEMMAAWDKLGGRKAMIEGVKNVFQALFAILGPIGKAFREIFPAKTGKDLADMSKNFQAFAERLKPSAVVIDGIKRTARGFFAVLHIGWSIVKGVIGVIGDLLGTVGKGSGGFLSFTGSIGDFLVAIDNALTKGGLLTSFFDGLTTILKVPLEIITSIASAIGGLFGGSGDTFSAPTGEMDKFGKVLTPIDQLVTRIKEAWASFTKVFNGAKGTFSPWIEKIGQAFSDIGSAISDALKGGNFDKVMTTLQTGFIGGIFFAIKKAIGGGGGLGGGIVKSLTGFNNAMGALTGHLKTMQTKVKAQIIFLIASSIGILAASVYLLSKVDTAGLTKAVTAISIGFGQLIGAMGLLGKVAKGPAGLVMMPLIAAAMVLLAGSMIVLGGAMKIFATMSWEELAKGLAGVGGGLLALSVGARVMGPMSLVIAPAILAIALSMNILALAVKQFGAMSWEDMIKGLLGVVGTLAALGVSLTAFGPIAVLLLPIGAGLLVVAFAMNMLAGAILAFGSMDLATLVKGIYGAGLALLELSAGLYAMPPHAAIIGAGLIIVAIALNGIATALKVFAGMSVWEIAKGIVAMGASLLVLAIGLTAMIASLPGALALGVAAIALAVLAPTLAFLGKLKWSTIFKGLAAIAFTLIAVGVAGTAAAPGLVILGAALIPLGLALVLVGTATYLFASAMSKLTGEGTKGIGVFLAAVAAFATVIPKIVIDFIKGLVEVAAEMAKLAPKVVDSIVKIINSIIEVVIKSTPQLAFAIGTLVNAILQIIIRDSPKLIRAGFTLLVNLLKGLDQNMPQIISRATSIVIKFISGLATKSPALISAGVRLIMAFLNGIAKSGGRIAAAAVRVVVNFLGGFATLPARMVIAAGRAMTSFLRGLGNQIPQVIRAGVRVVTRTLDGISSQFGEVANTATRFVTRFFNAFGNRRNVRKMVNAGFKAGINVLRGITDGIKKDENMTQLLDAAEDLGIAIVEGVGKGLAGLPRKLADRLLGPIDETVGKAFKKLKSKSPSKVFISLGKSVVDGVSIGLSGMKVALSRGITDPLAFMVQANNKGRQFGKFLGTEFKTGLSGGLFGGKAKSEAQTQIEGAFKALRGKLGEEESGLRENLKSDQEKLKQLMGERNKDWNKISKLNAKIFDEKTVLSKSKSASNQLLLSLRNEKNSLVRLSKEYERVSTKLANAKNALNELKSAQKSAFQSYKDQYDSLPDIDSLVGDALSQSLMTDDEREDAREKKRKEDRARSRIDQVALYKDALKQQIADTQKYMDTLGQLRAAGLDDRTYKKLLEKGTAGQEFATQLLAKGKDGIAELNKLDAGLAKVSVSIAQKAGRDLYQAGINAAQGLVNGLRQKQSAIQKAMQHLADGMVWALKRRLGIKSPSKLFGELGQYSGQGLADGLAGSSKLVQNAAISIGDDAATALTDSLASVSNLALSSIDAKPTVTPVLDLTQFQKDASTMQDLTNVVPITAAASYSQAAFIAQQSQIDSSAQMDSGGQKIIDFKFEQNNTSPKALDDVEIYRQTRNQLSQVKSAIGLTT